MSTHVLDLVRSVIMHELGCDKSERIPFLLAWDGTSCAIRLPGPGKKELDDLPHDESDDTIASGIKMSEVVQRACKMYREYKPHKGGKPSRVYH